MIFLFIEWGWWSELCLRPAVWADQDFSSLCGWRESTGLCCLRNTGANLLHSSALSFCFRLKYVLVFTTPQELLSIFECREGRSDSPGRRLWRRFPEQIQEILEPHLNSRLAICVHRNSHDPHTPSWRMITGNVIFFLFSGIRAVRRRSTGRNWRSQYT